MKRFLCDVDGVVCDFTTALLTAIGSTKKSRDISWSLKDSLSEQEYRCALGVLDFSGFWRHLPVVGGAQEGIAWVKSQGYDVYWVTSPWFSCPGWLAARYAWIEEHFGDRCNRVAALSCKHIVQGDVFLDDKPEHVSEYQSYHPAAKALLFNAHHNQLSPLLRVDWSTLPRVLT